MKKIVILTSLSICWVFTGIVSARQDPLPEVGEPQFADVFVDENAEPGGTGDSWANAFNELQQGLDNAFDRNGDGVVEIWIAEGTYVPTKTYTTSGGEIGGEYGEQARGAGGQMEADFNSQVSDGFLKTFNLSEVSGALTGKTVALYGGSNARDPVPGEPC